MAVDMGSTGPGMEFLRSFPQEQCAEMCRKCLKNGHLSKWPFFWGAGLMKRHFKYVCHDNSNVYTAFREYRENYMRLVWSHLRHVNR